MQQQAPIWDIEGPVQAEIYVVRLRDGTIELTGPCGAAPWLVELGSTQHPVEVVDRIVREVVGDPMLVHSTSWRRDRDAVVLSFLVVIGAELRADLEAASVRRVEPARSEATAAPRAIAYGQVLEHALRHLAWLAADDPVVADVLSDDWVAALAAYTPEPFRALG